MFEKAEPGKRAKTGVLSDRKLAATKTDLKAEEKKKGKKDIEEEKAEPSRRSARNVGKEANYNLDALLEAADEANEKVGGGGGVHVMLAQTYTPELLPDPTGWLISEKLDGVRCYWDGTAMYTRNGNPFYPPDWFMEGLPKDLNLDGELWTGRADFQKIVSIVRRQDQNEEWKNIKYMIFDAPQAKGTFKQRIERIKNVLGKLHKDDKAGLSKHVMLLEHYPCESKEHLMEELDKVTAKGGEGVMLKDPNSLYEGRRSDKLLKVKKFDDAEATVIGHEKGTGRCSNMCGAIRVRGADGIEFKIGSGFTDAQRRKPPKLGCKVTYKYMGKSNAGKPRFPIFMRQHPGM